MIDSKLESARLIPLSGIGSDVEAEQRASSAFLAVLSVVRDLSQELLTPLGASRAQKAIVETFIEPRLSSKGVRPDGMIRVEYGKQQWSALVEVKTGANNLSPQQINDYWDLAREVGVDHILTISNEIAPKAGVHPTEGLKVRSNSRVQVSHISWSKIVSTAIRIKRHKGVGDPEQAWILNELIRYLENPASGALDFGDMGRYWVTVRDAAREGTLSKKTEGVADVATRWDQLLRFRAMKLSADIGEDVDLVVLRGQAATAQRTAALIDSMCLNGTLTGGLRVPKTAGDLLVAADLRARRLAASIDILAPQDRGARGRVTWLVTQLPEAPATLIIEAYPKGLRAGTSSSLGQAREDRYAPLGADRREPHRFRIVMRAEMGLGRQAKSKTSSFIDSVSGLVNAFYGQVVQQIAPWQPPAPRLSPEPIGEPRIQEAVSQQAGWASYQVVAGEGDASHTAGVSF
jgi:hypothetical protein